MQKFNAALRHRSSDQSGINMVDLMMWLVIAALLLAAALQSIGYYQQAAHVYRMKEAINVASSRIMALATNDGSVDPDDADTVVAEENAATPNDGVTLSVETVAMTAAGASNDYGFELASMTTSTTVASGETFYLRAVDDSATKNDVVYFFKDTASQKAGIHLVGKGANGTGSEGVANPTPSDTATPTPTATTPTPTPTATPTPTRMVSVWDTSITGCSTITLPVAGIINANVNWGDGSVQALTAAARSHTYAAGSGTQTVTIDGTFTDWGGSYGWTPNCITEVTSWTKTGTTSLRNGFYGASNLTRVNQIPNGVTNLERAFYRATQFTVGAENWDVSSATNMTSMFDGASAFNGDISKWNTGNTLTMDGMFSYASVFNQNIGGWNTAKVTTMASMFSYAQAFNQDISNWNTSQVSNLSSMFNYAYVFDQPIGKWDTSNVTTLSNTFYAARAFNQDLSHWNTQKVTRMSGTFQSAAAFNQNVSTWDTSKVTTMASMFYSAAVFNTPLNGAGAWNTSNVTDMSNMFNQSFKFNQDISNWNTSKVTNMNSMFNLARLFQTDIHGWNVAAVTTHTSFSNNSGLPANYLPAFPS